MRRLFKNKKGEGDGGGSLQYSTFWLAELILGAIIIAGGVYLTLDLAGSSQTEVITKDFALLINSLSHETHEITYSYLLPEFVTHVTITPDTVTMHSNRGSSTERLSVNKNINFVPRNIANPKSIPLFFSYQDKELRFDPGTSTTCNNLRLIQPERKFFINLEGTNEEKHVLAILKNYLEQATINQEIFSDRRTNTKLELSFNEENDFEANIPRNDAELEALRCFIENIFQEQETTFNNTIIQGTNQENIQIKIGSYQDLMSKTTEEVDQKLVMYAIEISEAIKRGKSTWKKEWRTLTNNFTGPYF